MNTTPASFTNIPPRNRDKSWFHLLAALAATIAVLVFAGCAQKSQDSPFRTSAGSRAPSTSAPLERDQGNDTPGSRRRGFVGDDTRRRERSGLGTGFGEERDSYVSRTGFVRANGNRPSAVDRLYYNDREGIKDMLSHEGGADRRANGLTRMANGLVSAGLKDGSGRWLDGWLAGGRRFIAGERGDRYEIVVRNETRDRMEIVLSVDGLDVMDGRAASFSKRGYIVHPGDTLSVDGFRTSSSTVAAFRFSRVDRSYAALKHGDTRNVGVIGIAVFSEREPEAWRRRGANPFPGSRWATPPE